MKILNKEGLLFGKVNIIDLFIIFIVLISVAGGVYKLSTFRSMDKSNLDTLTMVIEVQEARRGLIDAIEEGDILYDSVRGTYFGKVQSKVVKPHKQLVIGSDGKVEFKEIPNLYDVEVQLEVKATLREDGILVGMRQIFINSEVRLRSNRYVFDSTVLNISY